MEQTRVTGAQTIAVVLPCYKSKQHVLDVIARIGPEAALIVAVDDACPMATGAHIEQNCRDPRLVVVRNETNLGVGGAVMHGYQVALAKGADIVVKIDSDGQMDPAFLPTIVRPILEGIADYTKGNRFFNIEDLHAMPAIRVLGNAGLSFFTKLSSGYWNIFDPTNGYTAVHRVALELLPLGKIDRRFFFESDILFRLNLAGAVVVDIPMRAIYADETSNLKISRIFFAFLGKNLRNFAKRIFYRYFLRDLNLGSLELVVGTLLLGFGTIFGATQWITAVASEQAASAGTVMLSGLPVLAGIQFLIGFFSFDLTSVPRIPLIRLLGTERKAEVSAPRQVATG